MKQDSPGRTFVSALLAALIAVAPAWPQTASAPAPDAGNRATKAEQRADEKRARQAFEKGQALEQQGETRSAFEAYDEAARYAPRKADYRARLETLRFELIQQHTALAERYAVAGRLDDARKELRAALALDPNYTVTQERLAQLERPPIRETAGVPPFATAPATVVPQRGTRDIDYRGDIRGAYEEIARQFGLTVSFDEDTQTRALRFRVGGVDFWTAMRLLGQQSKTFWRALDSRTFFVANDTPDKRKQYLPFIERSVVLPESERPEQMTETVRLVRELAGLTRAQLDTATRTLTMRGSEGDVALAVALVREIEQARGELMIEVEILEVDRAAARKLGITPPSSARIVTLSQQDLREAQQSTEGLVNVIERLFGSPASFSGSTPGQIASLLGTGGASLSSLVPPLIAFGGGQTVFLATLPGARADFGDTLSVVRSARRVLLRAQDGEPATFFVGDRFPITQSILSSNVGGVGVAPAVRFNTFTVGTGPAALITADFRGNNRLDLATANSDPTANSVSILLGNGDGTFSSKADFGAGTRPVALVSGDFRGNGMVDLAVANRDSNNVTVLLGNGNGTFTAVAQSPGVGAQPSAIVAADFNGDGHLDLAVANEGDNSISILLGNGDGTFQPQIVIRLNNGTGPAGLVAADFNGDSHMDLAVANSTSNTITVLLGDGTGHFPTQSDFTAGTKPVALATADFNGDGHADLAVANQGADSLSLFLGDGTGAFTTRTDFTLPSGAQPSSILAADLNRDNHTDLAVANRGANSVTVLFGDGAGKFPANVSFPSGSMPSGLASGDFNGDGLTDLAIANEGDSTVTVVLNSNSVSVPTTVQPYPGFQYEDLGLKVKATPRLHPGGDVTLRMEFEIRSLSATTFNSIPVISNRTVEQTARLKVDEPAVLAGILDLEKTRSITGFPGAAGVPGLGHAAGRRDTQNQQTELIIVVTPRRVRLAPRLDRVLYVGREGELTGGAPPPSGTPQPPTEP